jgi:hypothetical protein
MADVDVGCIKSKTYCSTKTSFTLGKNTAVDGEERMVIRDFNIYCTTTTCLSVGIKFYICEGTAGKRRRRKSTIYTKDSLRKRDKKKYN